MPNDRSPEMPQVTVMDGQFGTHKVYDQRNHLIKNVARTSRKEVRRR
ncbi:MAG: hypothetical protein JO287_19055 [Pseudonocardiales bacterium]|nr:hypothetical protein [Pseudonocardiales bacterium]